MNQLSKQVSAMIKEFIDKTQLVPGSILVVGCSTGEVIGSKIGTNSSPETAKILFEQIYEATKEKGIYLAAQCCEHLNRAIVIEHETVATSEIVNAVPQGRRWNRHWLYAYRYAS